jgi:hypothetical protein
LAQLVFEHREVTHQLLHTATGASRELPGGGVIHCCGNGTAHLSARRDSERASRSSAVIAFTDAGPEGTVASFCVKRRADPGDVVLP